MNMIEFESTIESVDALLDCILDDGDPDLLFEAYWHLSNESKLFLKKFVGR